MHDVALLDRSFSFSPLSISSSLYPPPQLIIHVRDTSANILRVACHIAPMALALTPINSRMYVAGVA